MAKDYFDRMAMNTPDVPISPASSDMADILKNEQTLAASTAAADAAATAADINFSAADASIADLLNPIGPEIQDLNQAVPAPTAATGPAITTATSDTNALNALNAMLAGYGLPADFGTYVTTLFKAGYQDASTIANIAQNPKTITSSDPTIQAAITGLSNEWQSRFSGNQARLAAGLDPLPASQYIANEQAYKQVLQMSGIPATSINNDTIGKLMAADVSPAEVNMRVNAATQAIQSEDPFVIQQLQSQYGLTTGAIALHLLDPSLAAPVIQQQVNAATVGAEAAKAGTDINQDYAMQLAGQGVTQAQAAQGFLNIATQLPGTQALASRYQGYSTAPGVGQQLQTATFGVPGTQTQAQAEAELQRLRAQETASFSGSSGAGKGTLMGSEEGQQ